MARKRIRLGMIGCGGNMVRAHIPRIVPDTAVDLIAAADPVTKQTDALQEQWSAPVSIYTDFRQMLKKEELDAVFISSPHSMHYEQVSAALRNKLHVLCEKPLTISSAHTKALMSLAKKQKRYLCVSYQRHYQAEYAYARELVAKGAIGTLRGVVAYVTQNWGGISGWRLDPALSGGGMFMDTGSHLVAATLWVTGLEPVEVSAFMDNAGKKVDINAIVNVRFKNGALGTLNTFGNALHHDERVAIHGSKGSLVFHLHKWQVKSLLLNDEPLAIPRRVKDQTPDAAFFGWIRSGGKGYEAPTFALQVARVSEAAYKSVMRKKPVKVAV